MYYHTSRESTSFATSLSEDGVADATKWLPSGIEVVEAGKGCFPGAREKLRESTQKST